MTLVKSLSKNIYQPFMRKRRGYDISSWRQKLRRVANYSPLELREYQAKELSSLLQYSVCHSSFYKEKIGHKNLRIDPSTIYEQLEKYPILTKDLVREHLAELKSNDVTLKGVYKNMTGGSTGIPLEFYQEKEYQKSGMANEIIFHEWWGISQGDKIASFWGADRELTDWSYKERLEMFLSRTKIFDAFAMSENGMNAFAKELAKWRPDYIKGYASALHLFSKFLLSHPEYKIAPKAIRCTAETLYETQRKDIEKAFGCKVCNFYGSREINNIAGECPENSGLHIFSGTRLVEVVNSEGHAVEVGETGRIIVTDLVNRAMPFIRYENGDLGVKSAEKCGCGRGGSLLKKIIGRTCDVLVGQNGQLVHGEYVTHLFYGKKGVKSFQLLQKSNNYLKLYIEKSGSNEIDLDDVLIKLRERIGTNIQIEVDYNHKFKRNSSGKHQFIKSDISPFVSPK